MKTFRSGVRPALNLGQSVTRVGGIAHNKRQKSLAASALKVLADYRQAEEFSHFGSELALQTKKALETGRHILEVLTQGINDTFSLVAQQLMLEVILSAEDPGLLDVNALRLAVRDRAKDVKDDHGYEEALNELKAKSTMELKKV
jgi:F-type H+-transporting ATPase subunit alpha